jgi:hypothetical protein
MNAAARAYDGRCVLETISNKSKTCKRRIVMPQLHLSDEEYNHLMERIFKILSRTEELDHVTHHWMWEVWRVLYYSKL